MTSANQKFDKQGNKKIECQVCGKYYHRLDVHLKTKHGMSVSDYNHQFPGAPTISESARQNAQQAQKIRSAGQASASVAAVQAAKVDDDPNTLKIGVARLKIRDDLTEQDKAHLQTHDPHWVFGAKEMEQWEALAVGIEHNTPVYIAGPTGCGKTAAVKELAAAMNQPLRRVQLNRDFKVAEFTGRATLEIDPNNGQQITGWKDGVATEAMRMGHWLLLDEIDQIHPDVLMKLQAILEGSALVLTENFGEVIEPHPNFRLIATANTLGRGDDSGLYAGAKVMNEATMDRFGIVIKAGYAEKNTEANLLVARTGVAKDMARKMVEVAHKVREALAKEETSATFSTRRLIAWATMTVTFGCPRTASKYTVLNKLEDEEDAQFINGMIQRYFGGDV